MPGHENARPPAVCSYRGLDNLAEVVKALALADAVPKKFNLLDKESRSFTEVNGISSRISCAELARANFRLDVFKNRMTQV
jgi:hypothetical protein